jgi:hypothetical protein
MTEGLIRYNVTEYWYSKHKRRDTVLYVVQTGRNGREKAFRLTVSGTQYSTVDHWPLRREIARHAGVDPDRVIPDWDGDKHREDLGRIVPCVWFVKTDDDYETRNPVQTAIQLPDDY